jgi:hypothetical protein
MSYLGKTQLKASDIKRFNVTSSTSATHTLTWVAPNEQSLIITINGVKQQEDSYSISGAVLTLTSALIATDKMEVVGIVDIGQIVVPGTGVILNEHVNASAAIAKTKLASLDIVNADVNASAAIALSKLATDPSNATNLASGTVPTARLGTGTANSAAFLVGDQTWDNSVPTINLDGTVESSPAEGDIWYASGKFNLGTNQAASGVWSSGGNLANGRSGPAGAGTQTAALAMGGYDSTYRGLCEEYNGTSWSAGGSLATARSLAAGAGTQNAGLCAGGYESTGAMSTSEEYDGTSFSAGGSLSIARGYTCGCGTQTAGLIMGGWRGSTYKDTNSTEEYDGTSWSTGGNLTTARHGLAGAGTQSAALSISGNIDGDIAQNMTEEYDGTSWSAGGNVLLARWYLVGAGTQSAAINAGGGTPNDTTEEYDGTAWSAGGDLITGSGSTMAGAGTQAAGLVAGGASSSVVTQEYTSPGNLSYDELFTVSGGL